MKPSEPGAMQDLIAARVPGRSLPGPLYVSQQAFDPDPDAIFGRHWVFAYEPGPYAPNEGQVEAFAAWYTGRLRARA